MIVMLVGFLTNDLVFPSRVKAVVERLGGQLVTAPTVEALAELLDETQAAVVLLDLNAPGVDPAQAVERLRGLKQPPRGIIAFGPHVHEARLAAAQAAGCDLVLTRGQFDSQAEALLRQSLAE